MMALAHDEDTHLYIHYNKNQQTYEWQEQPEGHYCLEEKAGCG